MMNRLIDPQLLERPLAFEWPRLRTKLRVVLLACISAVVLVVPAPAAADDTTCVGTLLAGTYDNVVVPPNGNCFIAGGVTIRGNLTALENSNTDVRNSQIAGNVHGDKAEDFQLYNNSIGGNVEVKEGETRSSGLDVVIRGNRFQKGPFILPGPFTWGNIKVERMRGNVWVDQNVGVQNIQLQENIVMLATNDELRVQVNSVVGGNVQVFKTRGDGFKFVNGNTVGGNVQCTENQLPFAGGPNTSASNEGQCF